VRWDVDKPSSEKGLARNNATTPKPSAMSAACGARLNRSLAGCWAGVSRWSPGSRLLLKRPDRATHQRYCALAPTEELRQQLTTAYEALPPLNRNQRRPALVRRSPEEWHGRALDGPGVYQLLSEKYPAYPVARLLVTRPSRCRSGRSWPLLSSGKTSRPRSAIWT
jgi:hypothetical protein